MGPNQGHSVARVCPEGEYVNDYRPVFVGQGTKICQYSNCTLAVKCFMCIEEPFLIKTGGTETSWYLKVTDDLMHVEGTALKEEAHRFTLLTASESDISEQERLHYPDCGFFLCYQTPGGQLLFLVSDLDNKTNTIVLRSAVSDRVQVLPGSSNGQDFHINFHMAKL